jgi:hypothetical protein
LLASTKRLSVVTTATSLPPTPMPLGHLNT